MERGKVPLSTEGTLSRCFFRGSFAFISLTLT